METLSQNKSLDLLSRLLINPAEDLAAGTAPELEQAVLQISQSDFNALVALADTNHVIVRALDAFRTISQRAGDSARTAWADEALSAERARIHNAVAHLWQITNAFTNRRHSVAVIKSLDHLPDLGSDLDLYTNAAPGEVMRLMREEFNAVPDARSWGDRLAGKWNFIVPGLPELVEIHVGRLGQTGEQFAIASSLIDRTRCISVGELMFRVPSTSDRLMISALQRMYRHFYFRLCDVIDSALQSANGQYAGERTRMPTLMPVMYALAGCTHLP